jgi:tRNA (guanine-N7-)-methyltransferase
MLLTTLARRRPVASGPWIRALCTSSSSPSIAGEAKPLAVKRVRQHVNPLARKFREPIAVPDWTQLFARPELPIHLDIGCVCVVPVRWASRGHWRLTVGMLVSRCARGKYLNEVAAQFTDSRNFLGVEIRRSVLEGAKDEAERRGSRNIAFVHANMNAHP